MAPTRPSRAAGTDRLSRVQDLARYRPTSPTRSTRTRMVLLGTFLRFLLLLGFFVRVHSGRSTLLILSFTGTGLHFFAISSVIRHGFLTFLILRRPDDAGTEKNYCFFAFLTLSRLLFKLLSLLLGLSRGMQWRNTIPAHSQKRRLGGAGYKSFRHSFLPLLSSIL